MSVTEESRHRLHQALDRTIGEEEATTLMEHLPPVGWADVATKADVADLRTATKTDLDHLREHIDLRFEVERAHTDARFEAIDARFEAIDARFEKIDVRFDATAAYAEHLFAMARLDTEHITESMAAHAKATNERLDDLGLWMRSMENRLTHQFWQFLTLVVAFGAILIGVLRYT